MVRWLAVTLVVVVTACRQIFGLSPIADVQDAPVSRVGDVGTLVPVHFDGTQPTSLTFTTETIDTSTDPRCTAPPGMIDTCIIKADTIAVTGNVTATGAPPLTLAALGTIDVIGGLDVSSVRAGMTGAGGQQCDGADQLPVTSAGAGGGGAGGSHGGAGGNGGSVASATGGHPSLTFPQAVVVGGCPGQDGAAGSASSGGPGGHAGGAVHLVAGVMIHVQGRIAACGAGGGVGFSFGGAGGGGGGAGGFIGLDAPSLAIDGSVRAEGGGGGASGGSTSGGADGCSTTSAATGGVGIGAGSGGDGSLGTVGQDGLGGSNGTGGGGGGGGAGYIYAVGTITGGGTISPTARNQ